VTANCMNSPHDGHCYTLTAKTEKQPQATSTDTGPQ
jgi:hypothetical protein